MSKKEIIITGLLVLSGIFQVAGSYNDASYEEKIFKVLQHGTVMLEDQNNLAQASDEAILSLLIGKSICESQSPTSCAFEKEKFKSHIDNRLSFASSSKISEQRYIGSVNFLAQDSGSHKLWSLLLLILSLLLNILILCFLFVRPPGLEPGTNSLKGNCSTN